MNSLQQLDIFEIRPLITNLNCKLCAVSEYDSQQQILCLVSEENDIVLRYTNSSGAEITKLVSWCRRTKRIIHDICFDPSGSWLLVLCFDNTLHIIPVLSLLNRISKESAPDATVQQSSPFNRTHITSYIIPFAGPHECPDSKKCPNHTENNEPTVSNIHKSNETRNLIIDSNNTNEYKSGFFDSTNPDDNSKRSSLLSCDIPAENLTTDSSQCVNINNKNVSSSTAFMTSQTCPYPLSAVWWRTIDGVNRAIIGYSDGCICFVDLTPNCPFVASTTIETGSVNKLFICRDKTHNSVLLLIKSSLSQQFKLVLEQKNLEYTYPGEIRNTISKTHSKDDPEILLPPKNSEYNICKAEGGTTSTATLSETSAKEEGQYEKTNSLTACSSLPIANTCDVLSPTSLKNVDDLNPGNLPNNEFDIPHHGRGRILPSARARLASLKSLGTKKINALKMRLSDNRQKFEIAEDILCEYTMDQLPPTIPELLRDSNESMYRLQNLQNTYLLSALNSQEEKLTVHNIDMNLKKLFLYKMPTNCKEVLISSNILYTIQNVDKNRMETNQMNNAQHSNPINGNSSEIRETQMDKASFHTDYQDELLKQNPNENYINAVGVISSAMATLSNEDEMSFNQGSLLSIFKFENETVLNLFQMASYPTISNSNKTLSKDEKYKSIDYKEISSPLDYVKYYEQDDQPTELALRQMEILREEFPKINYDPCYVITNKNVYYIQLKKQPFAIFLDAALAGQWQQCGELCNTFDLSYEMCMEFVGDYLLRHRRVTQALYTYNSAHIKPIRTALKLATFAQSNALIHLCAMALKLSHILKSKYLRHRIIKTLLPDITYRHSENVLLNIPILIPKSQNYLKDTITDKDDLNVGVSCTDFMYGVIENNSNNQMPPSSQFHLSNLLLISLAEKAVIDKNYLPLWNFLTTNVKYHTNMTSIVLSQSGLYSSALLLAKIRGVFIDTFSALTNVAAQEFGWYSELNVCLYNLTESIFTEVLTYIPKTAMDYMNLIQNKLNKIRPCVLKRLEQQLNPFSPIFRPILSQASSDHFCPYSNETNTEILDLCRKLIETYLAVLIHFETLSSKCDKVTNALNTFDITYEDNQFAIESTKYKPISAGCGYCSCIIDGIAYFWGSNGVPYYYNANKPSEPPEPNHAVKRLDLLAQLNLEIHAVKCGRQHTLILTNNGLYACGKNNLLQLGVGAEVEIALQPMLITSFDGKNIKILETGQYHNAVVADDTLYTWGWGIYGQLGHGHVENIGKPSIVPFFQNKKILQVSLGHAHSLVLCQSINNTTELFVFGSNHFGQLGLGEQMETNENMPSTTNSIQNKPTGHQHSESNKLKSTNQLKYLLPQKLEFTTANIRLIHTRFFSNLVVDENNLLYTWGSSPQALRLANQIKRRANAKQKFEEMQRREASRALHEVISKKTIEANSHILEAEDEIDESDEKPPDVFSLKDVTTDVIVDKLDTETHNDFVVETVFDNTNAFNTIHTDPDTDNDININTKSIADDDLKNDGMLKLLSPMKSLTLNETITTDIRRENRKALNEMKDAKPSMDTTLSIGATNMLDSDPSEHLTPHLVDTSEVAGDILQISSGLFHFALISSTCTLYTWGKNLEHQLGTEDKERRAVTKPSPIDSIEKPMYVDCGADFTLVMTTDYVVKAFGGNSHGQCGRDLGNVIDKMKHRIVCLPTTKRLMRFESQCVEIPIEINLPRPHIRLTSEPIRYLKFMPRYQENFLDKTDIFDADEMENHLNMNHTNNENENTDSPPEDLTSTVADNKDNTINHNNTIHMQPLEDDKEDKETNIGQLCDYIHYCLYIFHGLYNQEKVRQLCKDRLEYQVRILLLNFNFIEAFRLCLKGAESSTHAIKIFDYFAKDTSCIPLPRCHTRYLIYDLLIYFLQQNYNLLECENLFLADIDYYLLELAYVLFLNNNTLIEKNLKEKFRAFIAENDNIHENGGENGENTEYNENTDYTENFKNAKNATKDIHLSDYEVGTKSKFTFADSDQLFDNLSSKFKTIICQRLLRYCNNYLTD